MVRWEISECAWRLTYWLSLEMAYYYDYYYYQCLSTDVKSFEWIKMTSKPYEIYAIIVDLLLSGNYRKFIWKVEMEKIW